MAPVTYEVRAARGPGGLWEAHLDLIPGEYRYFFIVDGHVTVDAETDRIEQDDFGGVTGIVTVLKNTEGGVRIY